ncbi:MAG: hypothetical protein ACOYM3_10680 [Terrimicrobiaceae bacterium]
MIAEFAFEPEVMARWEHFKTFWGDFGIAQRRQLGCYPKQWKREVMDRARALVHERINTEMQVTRMEAKLSGPEAKPKFRKVDCSDWNEKRAWLENSCDHEPAFEVIVSSSPTTNGRILSSNDLLRDEPPYARDSDLEIERTPEAIVDAVRPLLAQSMEIILVEPNFDPREPRFLGVVERIVDAIHAQGRCPRRFEIHTSKYRNIHGQKQLRIQEHHFENLLSPVLYGGWTVTVCCWAENQVQDYQHPRFVLTEIGGIHIDWGLDAGEAGTVTIAKGLGENLHSKYFSKYSSTEAAFLGDQDNNKFVIT